MSHSLAGSRRETVQSGSRYGRAGQSETVWLGQSIWFGVMSLDEIIKCWLTLINQGSKNDDFQPKPVLFFLFGWLVIFGLTSEVFFDVLNSKLVNNHPCKKCF